MKTKKKSTDVIVVPMDDGSYNSFAQMWSDDNIKISQNITGTGNTVEEAASEPRKFLGLFNLSPKVTVMKRSGE